MFRLRCLDWSVSSTQFASICDRIVGDVYGEERGVGFIVEQRTELAIRGRFVRRLLVEEQVVDPAGAVQTFKRLSYETVEFMAISQRGGLAVVNPPRTVKPFLMRLSSLSGHSIAVGDLAVDLRALQESLVKHLGRASVRSMKLTQLALSPTVQASLSATGQGDIDGLCRAMVGERRHVIDQVEADFVRGAQQNRIRFSATGNFWIWPSASDELRDAVWSAARTCRVANAHGMTD